MRARACAIDIVATVEGIFAFERKGKIVKGRERENKYMRDYGVCVVNTWI